MNVLLILHCLLIVAKIEYGCLVFQNDGKYVTKDTVILFEVFE